MRRRLRLLSVLIFSALLLPTTHVGAGTIGGRPANPSPEEPRSSSIFLYTLSEEETKRDAITVSNNSDEEKTIKLYATDGLLTGTGSFSCKQAVEKREEVGAWIKFERQSVKLPPGEQVNVPFTVKMPRNASVGEHNGCIVMQDAKQTPSESGMVNLHFRSAIRMAITVPGEINKDLSFTNFWTEQNQTTVFVSTIKNDGNVSVDTKVEPKVTSLIFNNKIATDSGGEYPVMPGAELELRIEEDVSPFWGGWYAASMVAHYNIDPTAFGVNFEEEMQSIESDQQIIFITPSPFAIALYIVMLLGIAGGVSWIFRHHKQRAQLHRWQTYTVKQRDTIKTIAAARHTSWRTLARVNHIKAPYEIRSGQKIKVPPKNEAKT